MDVVSSKDVAMIKPVVHVSFRIDTMDSNVAVNLTLNPKRLTLDVVAVFPIKQTMGIPFFSTLP